jgi:hypothetical protein
MACGGTYSSWNTTIIAVGPADYSNYPCGTSLNVTGPQGSIEVTRQDSCPGCRQMVDLSEAGIIAVCGSLGSCVVSVNRNEE